MRGGRLHWYDLILFGLCAMIVYPDVVLDWIGERTGRAFGWTHVVLLEVIAIISIVAAMALLMPIYPRLQWWYPLLATGMLGVFRVAFWLAKDFFGFED